MSNRPDLEDEQFIANLKAELNRMDSALDEHTPSLADFHDLAVHTLANQKRRWRNELIIFLLVALFIVSAIFIAAWWEPIMLLLIHGSSMLIGAVILTLSLTSRESRDSHE